VADDRETRFRELVAYAEEDDAVLGLFIFGSRSRNGFADDASDYDVGVVVRDDALEAFDERWPHERGSAVEVASSTFSQLREHAEPGTPSEWARYQYVDADVLVDKTGELRPLLAAKARLPEDAQRSTAAAALDEYINATYRSLKNAMRGLERAARLDAAESIPPFLTTIFAFEGRVRPYNKYLEWELRTRPLAEPAWSADVLLPRIDSVAAADASAQRALFRDVERAARGASQSDVVDGWEPDLAWLRGGERYRSG
jgi:predicted nucleotidyltransferase